MRSLRKYLCRLLQPGFVGGCQASRVAALRHVKSNRYQTFNFGIGLICFKSARKWAGCTNLSLCLCLGFCMITRRWPAFTLKLLTLCRKNWPTLKLHCDWRRNSIVKQRSLSWLLVSGVSTFNQYEAKLLEHFLLPLFFNFCSCALDLRFTGCSQKGSPV